MAKKMKSSGSKSRKENEKKRRSNHSKHSSKRTPNKSVSKKATSRKPRTIYISFDKFYEFVNIKNHHTVVSTIVDQTTQNVLFIKCKSPLYQRFFYVYISKPYVMKSPACKYVDLEVTMMDSEIPKRKLEYVNMIKKSIDVDLLFVHEQTVIFSSENNTTMYTRKQVDCHSSEDEIAQLIGKDLKDIERKILRFEKKTNTDDDDDIVVGSLLSSKKPQKLVDLVVDPLNTIEDIEMSIPRKSKSKQSERHVPKHTPKQTSKLPEKLQPESRNVETSDEFVSETDSENTVRSDNQKQPPTIDSEESDMTSKNDELLSSDDVTVTKHKPIRLTVENSKPSSEQKDIQVNLESSIADSDDNTDDNEPHSDVSEQAIDENIELDESESDPESDFEIDSNSKEPQPQSETTPIVSDLTSNSEPESGSEPDSESGSVSETESGSDTDSGSDEPPPVKTFECIWTASAFMIVDIRVFFEKIVDYEQELNTVYDELTKNIFAVQKSRLSYISQLSSDITRNSEKYVSLMTKKYDGMHSEMMKVVAALTRITNLKTKLEKNISKYKNNITTEINDLERLHAKWQSEVGKMSNKLIELRCKIDAVLCNYITNLENTKRIE